MYFCKKVIKGMKKQVIYLLLMILTLCSCMGNKKYDALMHRADSIMNINDDSAKVAIQMLDGVKPQLSDFTKAQRMKYELLYHKAMNKADVPFTSDSIMKEVADYYEHHGSANERMLAYYVLGCVYRGLHEAPLALEYYNKATEQADTTAADCDYATLYRVYSQMGLLFDKQFLPFKEIAAYNNAEKYAYLAKDTFNAIVNFQNKEAAYVYLGEVDSAINVNLQAAKLFKQNGDSYAADIAFGSNYKYYIERQEYQKAKEAFETYLATGYDGNTNYEDAKAYILYERGLYYTLTSQLDSAYICLKEGLRLSKSYGNKAATTNALAQYYLKAKQPALAAEYALVSSAYNDSSLVDSRKDQLQQVQALYDYNRHQEIARKAEKEVQTKAQIIYIITIVSLVALFLINYVYRKNLALRKKKSAATKVLYEDRLLKYKRLERELSFLKAQNDKKLLAAIQEKEVAIKKLNDEMKELKEKNSTSSLSDIEISLRNTTIYKRIQYIELHPKETMQDGDWEELEATIKEYTPSLLTIFKGQVEYNYYHICLLVKLGFTTSSIANLIGISQAAVSAARKRMLERFCHKTGKPKDFDEYIRQLS